MNRRTGFALLCSIILLSACNRLSEQFRRDASFAYELIQSAEDGKTVLKADVEKAIATAKADAQTADERSAIDAVESYLQVWRVAGNSDLDRRYLEVCRWEAAKHLARTEPKLSRPARVGDCNSLLSIHVQHVMDESDCEKADVTLNDLEAKLKKLDNNPGAWLRVNEERTARQKRVTESCTKVADSKMPPLP